MAEAGGVAGLQATNPKFFCHKCNQEISHVSDDYTCPICNGGFIEEVQETVGLGLGVGNQGVHTSHSPFTGPAPSYAYDNAGSGIDFLQQILTSLSGAGQQGISRGTSTGADGGSGATNPRHGHPSPAPTSYRRSRSEGGTPGINSHHFSFVINSGAGGGGTGVGGGQQNPDGMENMLFTFLNDLVTGLGGGAAVGGVPILSNLGDYAWGRDGFDAIVTQLMNQVEGTGAPPLATEKIDVLPDLTISQDQLDRKLQCSVCWDDFSLNEVVKQLECEHLYHPDCIIPWLKLHGTCPICRKDLTGVSPEEPNAVPSARFEPMTDEVGSQTHIGTESSSESSRNSSSTSSDSLGAQQPDHHSSTQGSNRPSNPAANLLNSLFNPLMFGQGPNMPGPGSSPSNQQSDQQQRSQRGDGRTQGPGGGGGSGNGSLDNMDLDFD